MEKVIEEKTTVVSIFFLYSFFFFFLPVVVPVSASHPLHPTRTLPQSILGAPPSFTIYLGSSQLTAKERLRAKLVFHFVLCLFSYTFPTFHLHLLLLLLSPFSARFSLVMIKPERVVGRTQRAIATLQVSAATFSFKVKIFHFFLEIITSVFVRQFH
jgi:hypothetical protein